MPRPGPRPYECVRRAWHSDKHQPMRGSLIQEIFRVVNEVHTSTTKKNKEWQEKLPVVVLKAEEIMYSKANSEAEYMDLKTLLDRANDAINTIIRRDESTETGELLQPCIEAALNLGCIPRIPSRSQRNTNPRCYLASGIPEPSKFSASVVNRTNEAAGHTASSQFMPNLSNFVKPSITNLIASVPESRDHLATVVVPLSNGNHLSSVENFSVCSVYPLYCAGCLEPQHASSLVPESVLAAPKTFKVVITQNGDPPARDLNDSHSKPHTIGCDLSLRLGTFVATRPSTFEEGEHHDVEYGSSRAGGMLNDRILKMDKQLSFVTRVDEGNPLDPRVPGNRLDV